MSNSGVICYDAPSVFTIITAVVIIIASIISYVPQYWAIFRARSSMGLSYLSLASGYFSGMLTLINTGILGWDKIVCCRNHPHLKYYQCLGNNLVAIQVAFSPALIGLLYLLFMYFFETQVQMHDVPVSSEESQEMKAHGVAKLRDYFWAMICLICVTCFSILTAAAAYVMYYGGLADAEVIFSFAKVLGLSSALLVFFQWTPQIWTTYKMGHPGVLSLPMLLIQAPGSFLIVGFQISANADWTTWAPYIVVGVEQLMLIGLLIYFMVRDHFLQRTTLVDSGTGLLVSESDEPSAVQFTNDNASNHSFPEFKDVKAFQSDG